MLGHDDRTGEVGGQGVSRASRAGGPPVDAPTSTMQGGSPAAPPVRGAVFLVAGSFRRGDPAGGAESARRSLSLRARDT